MKTDERKTYEEQMKLSLISFIAEIPNFIVVIIVAIATGSILTWLDFIDSFGNTIGAGFMVLISKKLKKDLRYEFNYGIGKIEALSTLCCDILMMSGLIIIMVISLKDIIFPKEQSSLLLYVIFLKIVNVAFDWVFFNKQRRIKNVSESTLIDSEYADSLRSLLSDVVILISIMVCYLFRDNIFTQYFSPVAGICIAICFFINAVKRCKSAINTLTDKTIDEHMQLNILKVLNKHYNDYEHLISVNSRKSGNKIIVELSMIFKAHMTYEEIMTFLDECSNEIKLEIPNVVVTLVLSVV